MLTTLDKAVHWAQSKSMWPDTFGLACCAIEMMSIVSARYDIARFGMEAFRASPRQADLLIVSGRVVHKMAEPLRQIYDQMLEPKWVIAMGACASSGGMFNNYTTLQGVDKIVAVDVYVPGCPPRPEALMEGSSGCTKRCRQASHPPTRSGAWRRDAPRRRASRGRDRRKRKSRRRDDARRREGRARRRVHVPPRRARLRLPLGRQPDGLPRLGRGRRVRLHRHRRRPRPQQAGDAGLPEAAGAEAEAVRDELPPARAARRRRPACACRCGSTTARACRR